jgi:V/A-type H+-transporting ATPase subunit D
MSGASRSRLLELRRELEAAMRGREVLERKRELYLQELRRRTEYLVEERRRVSPALQAARSALDAARVELGRGTMDAAVLAQPEGASVELEVGSVLGTRVPRLVAARSTFRPAYGPLGTAASLDAAGAAFAALLPQLARLAELEATAVALRRGLHKTARRLIALERVIIPSHQAELRAVLSSLEEEERDETVRRRTWLAARERR